MGSTKIFKKDIQKGHKEKIALKHITIKSFCGGSRGAIFSKRAPRPPEAKVMTYLGATT
jgi:hypothetical protein